MEGFQTAINVVTPLFILLSLGVFLRKAGIIDEHTLNQLNKLAFKVFLSISLYYNIYTADISEVFDEKVLIFAVAAQLIIMIISLLIALIAEKTKKRRGAMSHVIFHTNFVIFGTMIGTALCGEGNIGKISLLIATIVPLQNILSVVVLALFKEEGKIEVKQLVWEVIKNPYVIAALLGFATQAIQISFPEFLENVIRDVGRCGAPIALIVMGGLFNFDAVKENAKSIIVGCFSRLILIPTIMIPIAVHFDFEGTAMIGLMCIFIAPCATSSFNLASMMDSDADLTSQLVVFTSLFSLGTIFAWIYILSKMGIV